MSPYIDVAFPPHNHIFVFPAASYSFVYAHRKRSNSYKTADGLYSSAKDKADADKVKRHWCREGLREEARSAKMAHHEIKEE